VSNNSQFKIFRYLLVVCQIVVTEGTEDWTSSTHKHVLTL